MELAKLLAFQRLCLTRLEREGVLYKYVVSFLELFPFVAPADIDM